MLILRHFYQASPNKLTAVLSEIVPDELAVGLSFEQQVKFTESVPDALISQAPFKIFFETKRGGDLDADQVKRHLTSITTKGTPGKKFLVGLTTTPILAAARQRFDAEAEKAGVSFAAATFAEIVSALRDSCEPHDTALLDILADYEAFLTEEGLLQVGDVMTAFLCGTSLDENIKHRLYFEPSNRSFRAHSKFLGCYSKKRVSHVGEIICAVNGQLRDETFEISSVDKGTPTDGHLRRIEAAISDASYYPNLGNEEHRFYLVDEMVETDFIKASKGGSWGARVFNLAEFLAYKDAATSLAANEVAAQLRGKTFD